MSDPIKCRRCGHGAVQHLHDGSCGWKYVVGPSGATQLQDWKQERCAREAGLKMHDCKCKEFRR